MTENRNIEPVYLFSEVEMTLDAPIRDVWPHLINYPSWQNYSRVEHVSGEPGQEGEVVLLIKEEKGFVFPPYYARTIKLEPQRRIVWKTYVEKGDHPIERFGFIDFRLSESDDKTRFLSQLIYEFRVPYTDRDELEAFRKEQEKNFAALHAATRPKLRKLVEQHA